MAIDTAEKRKSISGIPYIAPGVTPNSSQDQEWRQQAGWSYSGILAATPSVQSITSDTIVFNFQIYQQHQSNFQITQTKQFNFER